MPSDKVEIRVKRLNNGAGLPLPVYASAGAAGMDICAAEAVKLKPGARFCRADRFCRGYSAWI